MGVWLGEVTVDVDSSIVETYGLAKQGGARFTYNHVRSYHPLVAVIAGTGDVVHSRLWGGNAHRGRGAASFLAETFGRIRRAGPPGRRLRADSEFYSYKVVDACRKANVGVLDHGQDVPGIAHPDRGDRRGPVGLDPVLQ